MIPKIFLDTNILLDLLQQRPGYEDSSRILQAGESGKLRLCCSYLTMANIAFILRKSVSKAALVPTLLQIQSIIEVLPMDADQLRGSYWISGRDFEDVLQAICAAKAGCTTIVTNNIKDFQFKITKELSARGLSLPPIITPSALLAGMA